MRIDTEFSKVAQKYPDRLAIKYGATEYTFSEVERNSNYTPLGLPHEVSAAFYIDSLAAMKRGGIAGAPATADPIYNDGAWLASTSGTTGSSKAVVHGHKQMIALAQADREFYKLTPDDRIGIVRTGVPAYRLGFAGLLSGTPIVIKPVDADLGDWINEEGITILNLTATGFRHLMLSSASPFQSLRILEVGGEMLDWGDVELYQKRFLDNCKFVCRYACAETHVISRLVLDKSSKIGKGRLPVGYPAKGVEIRLELISAMPRIKEIVVHSPYLAIEYWNDDSLTSEKFNVEESTGKRWYRTGDAGWFDDEGCLHHEGRII